MIKWIKSLREMKQKWALNKRRHMIAKQSRDIVWWLGKETICGSSGYKYSDESINISAYSCTMSVFVKKNSEWVLVCQFYWLIDEEVQMFKDGCWTEHVAELSALVSAAKAKYKEEKCKEEQAKWSPVGLCDPCASKGREVV